MLNRQSPQREQQQLLLALSCERRGRSGVELGERADAFVDLAPAGALAQVSTQDVVGDAEQIGAQLRWIGDAIVPFEQRQQGLLDEVFDRAGDLVAKEPNDRGRVPPAQPLARDLVAGPPSSEQLCVAELHADESIVYHSRVRTRLATLILLAGCRSEPESEPEPARADAPVAEPDPDVERKRECIAAALPGADPRYHALIRSVCAEWVERDIPGVSIAIVEPDTPPFTLALGQRCSGEDASVEPSTPFRFGSISKTITAALALGLVAEGRLTLDSRASELVPGYQNQADLPDPTLAALLRHRSGLGDIEPQQLVALGGEWLPALARSPKAGAPGEYHYSNSGYSVIGAMLTTTSEQDYASLIDARIAQTLQLPSITAVPARAHAPACGHLEHDRDRHPIAVIDDLAFMPGDPRWMNPAGGVLGSATDLARFALALGTDRLPGSAAMLELGEPYGYGLRSWALDEHTRAYGHGGNNVAFAAELLFVPGRRAIVLLANCGAGLPASVAAAEQLLAR
jgi:CubicO group peptidase (beta-lactamase class C family)